MRSFGSSLIGLALITLMLGVGGSNAQSGRTRPTPTPTPDEVNIITEELKLNVLAFDEDGKFFKDVRSEDLVIAEDNILHQPSSVRRIPANVLIVLDTGGELRAVKNVNHTRLAAKGIVDALRDGDSIAVMQYADKPEILAEWTSDKSEANAAISRAKFGRRSAFVDAVEMATDFLQKSGVDNKHLVLITDGTDSGGRTSARFDAFRRILGTDITVHLLSYTRLEIIDIEPRASRISNTPAPALPPEVVQQLPNGVRDRAQMPKVGPTIVMDRKHLRTMRNRQADLEAAEDALTKLVENTNGELLIPTTLDEMIERASLLARMIDASYVVTYTPKVPLDEKSGERTIRVMSKRPGLIVESMRKFVAPGRR